MKKLLIISGVLSLCFCLILLTKLPALGLDRPEFCGKCHAMDEQVQTYMHSAHRLGANCGDCHIPHSIVSGAMYKAYTGTKDVISVLANKDPYEIRISPIGRNIVQDNCLRCHSELLQAVGDTSENGGKYCFDCHRSTPHQK